MAWTWVVGEARPLPGVAPCPCSCRTWHPSRPCQRWSQSRPPRVRSCDAPHTHTNTAKVGEHYGTVPHTVRDKRVLTQTKRIARCALKVTPSQQQTATEESHSCSSTVTTQWQDATGGHGARCCVLDGDQRRRTWTARWVQLSASAAAGLAASGGSTFARRLVWLVFRLLPLRSAGSHGTTSTQTTVGTTESVTSMQATSVGHVRPAETPDPALSAGPPQTV